MPAYFLTNTATSDASADLNMSCLNYNTTTLVVSLTSLNNTNINWITSRFYPNTTTTPSGSGTVIITHTVTSMSITVSAQIIRVNSTGGILASGTAAASQTTAATNTFTNVAYPSWTGASCSDRLILRLIYTNTAMNAQSCTIGLDREGTYLLTTIDHNGSGCPVLRKPSSVISFK